MAHLRKYGAAILLSCIPIIAFLFLNLPLNRQLNVAAAHAEEKPPEPLHVRIKYLFGFNGRASGLPFGWVNRIMFDNNRGEVYLLDSDNQRVVITNMGGIFLYQFKFAEANIQSPTSMIIDPQTGNILMGEGSRVAVLDYKGRYKRDIDLSGIPDKDKDLDIQSIALDKQGNIYMGGRGRVEVVSQDGRFIREIGKKQGMGNNIKGMYVDEGEITFLDPAGFSVMRFSIEGKFLSKFGNISSLLGGFSQPTDMAVYEKKKRIIVVDNNRTVVIGFDWEGNPLFEFGGPEMFRWPRAVGVNKDGHIYVADNTGVIRVFEVIE
ncbi:MAG: NHL repeat-containing protein [Deltaproteobacteria bacterium]|nr:NHL repeat-containing protein [Deltaproteobacteria bacterium]